MNVVAINGSPKVDGNTFHAIKLVTNELENNGISTEIIHVGDKLIHGCIGCNMCARNRDEKCVLPNDIVNETIQKMKAADGIILGSPVYYSGVSGTMKSFLDRAFYVAGVNKNLLRGKVGASVVAVRRTGGMPTFEGLNHYINYSEMLMPSSSYWNVIHGTRKGEVLQDEEGTQIMRVLGKNMTWLLNLVNHGREAFPIPEPETKIFTNFIR